MALTEAEREARREIELAKPFGFGQGARVARPFYRTEQERAAARREKDYWSGVRFRARKKAEEQAQKASA